MVILRITLLFNVPIFNCTNDMGLVRRAELKLYFITPLRVGVLQKQIKPPCSGLNSFNISKDQITQPQNRGIIRYDLLYPFLVVFWIIPQINDLRFYIYLGLIPLFSPRDFLVYSPTCIVCFAKLQPYTIQLTSNSMPLILRTFSERHEHKRKRSGLLVPTVWRIAGAISPSDRLSA